MPRLAHITIKTAFVALLLLLIGLSVPVLLGYQRYVIVGHSMEPTIRRGSVIFSKPVPVSAIRPGDIISFETPPEYGKKTVTHRLREIARDRGGNVSITSKGDNNRAVDPWQIQFPGGRVMRYGWNVPFVGYAFGLIESPERRSLVVALPAVVVGMSFLWTIAMGVRRGRTVRRETASTSVPISDPTVPSPDSEEALDAPQ